MKIFGELKDLRLLVKNDIKMKIENMKKNLTAIFFMEMSYYFNEIK